MTAGDEPGPRPADLYRDTILRHSREPTGFGKTVAATHANEQFNPLCGDRVLVQLQVADGRILDAGFEGESCAICKASASILCAGVSGKPVTELADLKHWLNAALSGGGASERTDDLAALTGVKDFPSRIDCALLPWTAGEQALLK